MMHKTCAVVGGGVAGIQASLDLAEMGVETYLIEHGPSIGGRMAQLDKTFPTNDCAMCILSPKLVEVGSHPYVHILSNSEIVGLEGEAPDFKLSVLKRPRFVDEEKCTGCGICETKCPTRIPDPYNKGLNNTRCIHIPFPQAVPALPIIDKDHCIYLKRGKCRVCEKVCEAGAVDFEQQEQLIELNVGSIILSAGLQEFDARRKYEYGYGSFPNVLTSIEFERVLSACGPAAGHVIRPSDEEEPQRIAILQCVGSRDSQVGNEHCSAICCMQAAKAAIIAREHLPGVQTTIFCMDIRSFGKGFDRFVDRSRDEYGTRFIRGRIATVEADPRTDDLLIQYNTLDGKTHREEFDLLVLSVGLEPGASMGAAIHTTGAAVNQRGFLDVHSFSPVNSSRTGVFSCGSISGPKDIPESVIEASGAASAAASVLGELPTTDLHVDYPPEKDIRGEPPKVGVFVCRCGINIASTVDVQEVVEYVSGLPRVDHAQELMFACAQDSQKTIKATIEEKGLNRVVVCACTPRTHEPLFQKALMETSLNPYLFEFANIREQCAWVHRDVKDMATEKAKDLARNAISKVILAEPLYRDSLGVNKDALVVGAGLAGMTAALDLADQGFTVHLIEKEDEPGGNLRRLHKTLGGDDISAFLQETIERVHESPHINLYLGAKISAISGYMGNFRTTLESVDHEIEHGVVIIATGAQEYEPQEYEYGNAANVVTQLELEQLLHSPQDTWPSPLKSVVMIQCVGSRDDEHPYCSRICCGSAVKNAIRLKELSPRTAVYVFFQDMLTYGLREGYYLRAREAGVIFIRLESGEKPEVALTDEGLTVEAYDRLVGRKLRIHPDLLVLSSGVVPNPENRELSQLLKVPLDADAFFLEAHVKLRPVDFATDGVFVCGLAHYPKDIGETIAQARAAAGRAATVLTKDKVQGEARVSHVAEQLCSGCGTCVDVCAFKAVELVDEVASINGTLCKGCGACAASCRGGAIDLRGFRNKQILAALASM